MKNILIRGIVLGAVLSLLLSPLFALQAGSKAGTEKININTASLDDLQKLPRIGEKIAQRILDFRKANGNFKKIEELMKVKGIGEKLFSQIKEQITIGPESAAK